MVLVWSLVVSSLFFHVCDKTKKSISRFGSGRHGDGIAPAWSESASFSPVDAEGEGGCGKVGLLVGVVGTGAHPARVFLLHFQCFESLTGNLDFLRASPQVPSNMAATLGYTYLVQEFEPAFDP